MTITTTYTKNRTVPVLPHRNETISFVICSNEFFRPPIPNRRSLRIGGA